MYLIQFQVKTINVFSDDDDDDDDDDDIMMMIMMMWLMGTSQ